PNYESEIKKLHTGCSVTVTVEVKASPAKGQATEVHADAITVHGWADPETYPMQKKQHSFEFLRTIAHLRPRTNTFGAVAPVRNPLTRPVPPRGIRGHQRLSPEKGLPPHHPADHPRQRLRGRRPDVQGDHARPGQRAAAAGRRGLRPGLLPQAGLPDRQRTAGGGNLRL